jgi:beta-glucosidase-like glycosyl hydrolase/CubicO group peptidase (beta-lactamase class C family)
MGGIIIKRFFRVCFVAMFLLAFSGIPGSTARDIPFAAFLNDTWVNSTLGKMTQEEKIGQLIMLTAYPNQGEAQKKVLIDLIKKYKPGGILVMQGSPYETAKLINDLQAASTVPLLIAIDGETGLGFRLDSTISYPQAQTLGAIADEKLVYQMGIDVAKQFKLLGIHINFAPVSDINTNPSNPVINFRSFGEGRENVAQKAIAFSLGMQDGGILAVGKHFPGHGDTRSDSHETLPILNQTKERIDSIEVYPFKQLIDSGVGGIMTGHLNVSSFDEPGIPASLSENLIAKYLKEKLGFKGLIVTDAMNMKGVSKPSGRAEVDALKAGNDMVEFVISIEKAVAAIKSAIQSGEISDEDIEIKCRKILAVKRWVGLNNYKPSTPNGIADKLNDPLFVVTQRRLIENSLTVLVNKNILPIDCLDSVKIASVSIGKSEVSKFQKMAGNYTQVEHFFLPKDATPTDLKQLLDDLRPFNLVIGGIHGVNRYPGKNYGITSIQAEAVKAISILKKSVFVFFGNAYALKYIEQAAKADGLVMAYEDSELTQELAAQMIFGAIDVKGKLPVSVGSLFKSGEGMEVKNIGRLKYTIPEEAGIRSSIMDKKIDGIARQGIYNQAYPGCQVLIAKDGKVIFHKCYGYLTYKKDEPVVFDNLYDLASITKIAASTPALMKLYSEGKINIDEPMSKYWPDWIGSNKEKIIWRDILAHQGRLQAWLPSYQDYQKKNGYLKSSVFRNSPSKGFDVRVSSGLYLNQAYRDSIYKRIKDSPLLASKKYVYSDLSFIIYPKIVEKLTGSEFESYLKNNFFHPLGAYTFTYNPYKNYPISQIVPTENDYVFRKELIRGYVHDETAAMLGGISGHAGLFVTVNDMAKLMQMYLQKGQYGGRQYIPEKTIVEFTRCQFPQNGNRRGLGFDKPYIGNNERKLEDAYPAPDAGKNSFGHTGFTGTFVWADPDNQLILIFFTNRVNPTRENTKLTDMNLRTEMHQAIYDCIKKGL